VQDPEFKPKYYQKEREREREKKTLSKGKMMIEFDYGV
jgi:hypothetical protein